MKKHNRKSLTVLELLPGEKMRSQSWNRYAGFPQSRYDSKKLVCIPHFDNISSFLFCISRTISGDGRNNTTKQLAEVQAKLLSLRHRLWTGMNDGDNLPLSWGFASYSSDDIPK